MSKYLIFLVLRTESGKERIHFSIPKFRVLGKRLDLSQVLPKGSLVQESFCVFSIHALVLEKHSAQFVFYLPHNTVRILKAGQIFSINKTDSRHQTSLGLECRPNIAENDRSI